MESKGFVMNCEEFEEFCRMPEAISFEYRSYYSKKKSVRRYQRNIIRHYNHIRKDRQKRNKEKWKGKHLDMSYS